MTEQYKKEKEMIKIQIKTHEEAILIMKNSSSHVGINMVSRWKEEMSNLFSDLSYFEVLEKSTTVKEMNKKLNQRFSDLKLSAFMDGEVLYVHSIGLETEEYASKHFRIAILPHELKFKKGYEIHPDLILLANEFRRDYFNVL